MKILQLIYQIENRFNNLWCRIYFHYVTPNEYLSYSMHIWAICHHLESIQIFWINIAFNQHFLKSCNNMRLKNIQRILLKVKKDTSKNYYKKVRVTECSSTSMVLCIFSISRKTVSITNAVDFENCHNLNFAYYFNSQNVNLITYSILSVIHTITTWSWRRLFRILLESLRMATVKRLIKKVHA